MNDYTQDYLNIIGKMTPDELMKLNPMLSQSVQILIEACKETFTGKLALIMWDEVRGKSPSEAV